MIPMISVIIPAYNAQQTIADCLRALQCQTVRSDQYEIIVVDDGSTDDTAQLAQIAGVQVIRQHNRGPAAARNTGVAAARGELVLFTDADCVPSNDWVAQMVSPFRCCRADGVKGTYRTRQRQLMARFVQLEYEDKYGRLAKQPLIDFIDTYSAGYRRNIFMLNGGFDTIFRTSSVEDQEFSFRLAQKGYRLLFAPGATVYHVHDRTVREYFKRKLGIGYWKALLLRWHPEKLVKDSHTPQVIKVQMLLAALTLVALPLSLVVPIPLWLDLLLPVCFVLSGLPFAVKVARKDLTVALLAPLFLWVRACALGTGLVAGFIANRQRVDTQKPVLSASQHFVKRTMDVTLGAILLVCCLPLWLIVAVLIKLDSRGPVFFVQKRVGENGRVFQFYKFRTMVAGAERRWHERIGRGPLGRSALKQPNDARVTRLGRFLRRTSLDETPNLINVLRGEMSLVGPRPEEVNIVAQYTDWHRRRLLLKPGITGPMQINGRGALALDERVHLEIAYIENYSFWRDVQILIATIPVVVSGEGAY